MDLQRDDSRLQLCRSSHPAAFLVKIDKGIDLGELFKTKL